MIRVHLIRHCYPSLSAISDMGIKCWTCFWVILGAQRATTYTPLNQWSLGFVVKPRAQCESVFPEQSPCPRSGFAAHLVAHFFWMENWLKCSFFPLRMKNKTGADQQPCVSIRCFNFVWFWRSGRRVEWQLHPPQQEQRRDWASQSNSGKKTKNNSLTTGRFCGNGSLMLLCLWSVSTHLLSPRSSPSGWQKKKSPF